MVKSLGPVHHAQRQSTAGTVLRPPRGVPHPRRPRRRRPNRSRTRVGSQHRRCPRSSRSRRAIRSPSAKVCRINVPPGPCRRGDHDRLTRSRMLNTPARLARLSLVSEVSTDAKSGRVAWVFSTTPWLSRIVVAETCFSVPTEPPGWPRSRRAHPTASVTTTWPPAADRRSG
jgi:hypothetical protein